MARKAKFDKAAALINLLDDSAFKNLTAVESKFNIFDALGVCRQELRHSDFLSYLLSPNRPHGLGDKFLREFLIKVLPAEFAGRNLNHISVRTAPFDDARVRRQWRCIDILIQLPNRWVIAIENKVGAAESEGQLQKYKVSVHELFGGHDKLYLFLTPGGDEPSDQDWSAISYQVVYELAHDFAKRQDIPQRTQFALRDYAEYLEANVLDESNITELCRQIYRQHRDAIDLIMKHVTDPRDVLKKSVELVLQRLKKDERIELDHKLSGISRFYDCGYDDITPSIRKDSRWTNSKKGILLEWIFSSTHLRLDLVLGPMEKHVKDKITQKLLQHSDLGYVDSRAETYNHIHKTDLVHLDDIQSWESEKDTVKFQDELYKKILEVIDGHRAILVPILTSVKRSSVE